MEGTIDRKGVCRVKKAASLSSLRRSTLLAGSLAAALACSVAPAGAAPPGPDPSPPASAPQPDPVPGSAPTRTTAVRQPQVAAPAAPQPATRATAPVSTAPKPSVKRPPKPAARPAAEPRRATLDLAARIDHSLPASAARLASGADPTLLASLGLFALVLASSSLLWLLHVRAEVLR